MRPSLIMFLVVYLQLLRSQTQGIRLLKSPMEDCEKTAGNAVIETGNGSGEEAILCTKEQYCSSGSTRILLSPAMPTSSMTSSATPEKGARAEVDKKKTNISASSSMVSDPTRTFEVAGKDDGLTDINEMDYSPAKRKTPIHN